MSGSNFGPVEGLAVSADAAGFPVVRWKERRGLYAPQPGKVAEVECRIAKDGKTGELLFVTRGHKRFGSFEAAYPWAALRSFSIESAEHLYYSRSEAQRWQQVGGKAQMLRWLLGDSGQVIVAQFASGETIHLNYVDASRVVLEQVHIVLAQVFVQQSETLAALRCAVMWHWPLDDDRVPRHDPDCAGAAGDDHNKPARPINSITTGALGNVALV